MITEIFYSAKQDMPFKVAKGSLWKGNSKDGYFLHNNDGQLVLPKIACPFDVGNEPSFFERSEVHITDTFKVGEKVCLVDNFTATVFPYEVKKFEELEVVSTRLHFKGSMKKEAYIELKKVGAKVDSYYTVPIRDVVKSCTYYFINSSGEVHSAQHGKDSFADKYRTRTGNYFDTKENAVFFLNNIMA